MKHSVGWHEKCLFNFKSYIERREKELDLLTWELKRDKEKYSLCFAKFEEAKRRGLKAYDEDRFMEPRSKHG